MFKNLEIKKWIGNWKLLARRSLGGGGEIGNFEQGFTLVEVILYVAIFSSVALLVITSVFQIFEGTKANQGRLIVEKEANFIMQKIAWSLGDASAFHEPTGGATSSRLSVDKGGFSGNPVVIRLNGGVVELSRASGTFAAISNNHAVVQTLVFEHIPVEVNSPEGVKITFVLRASSTDFAIRKASTTLMSTIYLRQ